MYQQQAAQQEPGGQLEGLGLIEEEDAVPSSSQQEGLEAAMNGLDLQEEDEQGTEGQVSRIVIATHS